VGSTTLTVTAATLVSIAVTPVNPSVAAGKTQQFTATGTYSDSSTQNLTASVTWASGTTATATITSAGLASALKAGTSTISATSGSIVGSTTLTVTAATLVSIAVTPVNPSVAAGKTQQFTATGTYSDSSTQNLTGSVTWASGTLTTATITGAGLASALKAGTSTISATSGSIVGSTTLTVTTATLVSIAVTPANPSVAAGKTQQFTATGTYSDSSTQNLTASVTWASGTTATATINAAGLASALKAGTSTISATSGAIVGSTTLTVTAATLVSIAVTPANPSIATGGSQQFTATGTYTDSSTQNLTTSVTWASGTTATATINAAGLATAGTTAGSTTITATSGTVVGSTTLTVTSSSAVPTILSVVANSGLQGQSLTVTITGQNTHFVNGTTQANFGPGVTVGTGITGGYGPLTVTSSTTATAQLNISASAPFATRTVAVKTGSEQESLFNGFSVNGAPMVLYVSPNYANPGTSVTVAITGMFTHFQQGTSLANFGAGISVGGGAVGAAGPITVTSVTTATANLTIASGATLGLRAPITVTTGAESAPWSSPGFFVLGPVTGPFPTVTITSPTEGADVTTLTTVTGTVVSPNLAYWTLAYEGSGSTTFTQFATGTASTVTGTFDPTLLLNGIATIQLTGVDQSGQTSNTVVHVVIIGSTKIGNFTLSFTDLSVPVAGIPIQITRTYDSRIKSSSDFGFGWELAIKSTQVTVSDILGNNWNVNESGGGLFPEYCVVAGQNYVISIRLQNGTVYQFAPSATPATQCSELIPPETVDLQFTPIGTTPANATLTQANSLGLILSSPSPGPTQLLDQNTFDVYGTDGDTDLWTLTLPTGQQLQISMTLGLESVTDPNGNSLTFGSGGVTSSTGKGVTFARDAQNRITTITDPNGNRLQYSYDAAGDLTTFTDQLGHVSTYTYDGNHDLLSYTDPSGNQPVKSVYDDSGRLIQEIDAFGHVINFTNSMAASSETVADALGNLTTFVYDANGNVLEITDALGDVTSYTYDANNDLTSKTNALGKTYTYTYDANGNRLTDTDPLGNTNTYTYSSLGKVMVLTDPNGHVATSNTYDANGNQLTAMDALGHTKTMVYSAGGLLTSVTDLNGNTSAYTYDASGDVLTQTDSNGTVTTNTYDANGNRLSQSVTRTTTSGPQTVTTQYQYDAANRVTLVTNPDGTTNKTTYTATGQKASQVDQLGHMTAFQYNVAGQLTQTSYPDGTMEMTSYDADGHRTQFTSRSGASVSYVYDALGRVSAATDPLGNTSMKSYDAIGEVIANTDPMGNTTTTAYDAAGRVSSLTDPKGGVTAYTFDAAGNRLSTTDPDGHVTSFQYDGENDVIKIILPDGTFQTNVFDNLGNITSTTDAAGKVTSYTYDTLGHLLSVTDAIGTTKYTYDQVGNRISQTDANGHTTTFQYDQFGHRTGRTLPAGQTESYTYDANGNQQTHTDFNGKTTTYTYDSVNRLLSVTPDPSFHAVPITLTYNSAGQRASMTDPSGVTTYQYDAISRLTQVTKPNGTISYTYNADSDLTGMSAGSLSVTYAYDARRRLTSVSEPNTGLTSFTYDAAGNLTGTAYPNGVSHAYTYDVDNRLTDLAVAKGATSLQTYAYTLDATGHRLTVAELSGRAIQYTYDAGYHLTGESISNDPNSQNGTIGYTLDLVANRLQRSSTVAGVPATTLAYDPDDRLSSDTYDANGNTTVSGGITNAYDFMNHLIQHGTITYVYDGDGNRVSKTSGGVTTKYLVDDLSPTGLSDVIQETGSDGSSRELVYGLYRISQRQFIPSSSTTLINYYVYDGHGSVRELTNPSGAVTDTYTYDAFGNLIHSTGTTPNEFLFDGEQFDADLGYYYSRARYYNAFTGRFITIDSLDGDPQSPVSLHRYLYSGADPVNNSDPTGLEFDFLELGISSAIIGSLAAVGSLSLSGVLAVLISVLTFHNLPSPISTAFLKRPDASIVGGSILINYGAAAGGIAKVIPTAQAKALFQGLAFGLQFSSFGEGAEILTSLNVPQFWCYGIFVPFAFSIATQSNSVDGGVLNSAFKLLEKYGIKLSVSGYAGFAYATPTADSYEGPFFCFGSSGLLAQFLPRIANRPDITVCSSAPGSDGSQGAYTWTATVVQNKGFSIGAYYSLYYLWGTINDPF
jgi:RHS repeat-associated protein